MFAAVLFMISVFQSPAAIECLFEARLGPNKEGGNSSLKRFSGTFHLFIFLKKST